MYYIYIVTNDLNSTFYIGVTSDLVRRVYEHDQKLVRGFTYKYNVYKLVYFETFTFVTDALNREKQLKSWRRDWKISLVKKNNPEFRNLFNEIV